jgi:hypothetical protein
VIFVAAILRRWWAVVAASFVWPLVLVVWGDVDEISEFLGAGLLGAANAAVGAMVGTAVATVVAGIRRRTPTGSR